MAFIRQWFVAALLAACLCPVLASAALADAAAVQRGKYLVQVGGCSDCHTPGSFFGKPDMARYLGGSDVGFGIPGVGVFVGRNLTPDDATGLGEWTQAEIVTALQTGVRPDGRILAPVMPWRAFAHFTKSDAMAVAAYLKSLPPVHHAVPGPFGPQQKVSVFVMQPLPSDVFNNLLPPGK
jgi:mono/diheme cytochrome c family protein